MHRALVLVLALAAALATASPATAATLTTDSRCYQETQEIVVSGTGYVAGSADRDLA